MTNRNLEKAIKLYENFRLSSPNRIPKITIDHPKSLMVMGYLDYVGYSTTRDGEAQSFQHDFHKGSKPILCVDPDTQKLYLIEGRYRVTERGIVDLDTRGRELDD